MNQKTYLSLTATIFLIVALAHLARVLFGLEVSIDGWMLPSWLSLLAAVLAAFLSYSGFTGSKTN